MSRALTHISGHAAREAKTTTRPTFIVRLRPLPGVDPIRALRAALKVLGRRFGLKAVEVKEEETTA